MQRGEILAERLTGLRDVGMRRIGRDVEYTTVGLEVFGKMQRMSHSRGCCSRCVPQGAHDRGQDRNVFQPYPVPPSLSPPKPQTYPFS